MRPDGLAAIDHARRHGRELHRRGGDEALADAGHEGLAQDPGLTDHGAFPGLGGDLPRPLTRRVETEFGPEAKPVRHARDVVDTDAAGDLVEIHIAGFRNATVEFNAAMAVPPPAMKPAVAEIQVARTEKARIGCDQSRLERGERDDHLEG